MAESRPQVNSQNEVSNKDVPLQIYSGSAAPDVMSGRLTATYGNGSNRLLQNFLTESGVSPTTSHGQQMLDNAKDEPSIASGLSSGGKL